METARPQWPLATLSTRDHRVANFRHAASASLWLSSPVSQPTAPVSLADLSADYAAELAAWRVAVRAVARHLYREHLRDDVTRAPAAASGLFAERLLDYLHDHGDLVVRDGRAVATFDDGPIDAREAVAAYLAGSERRAGIGWFLAGLVEVAGDVLRGRDLLRLLYVRSPREVSARWEHAMLHAPILAPCRAFAARSVAAALTKPTVVLEGGAGVGVVLRTLLADPALAPRAAHLAAWHFTELDPSILARGRDAIACEAPPSVVAAMQYRRLDLDALPADPSAAGLAPGSVDLVVLEHVLYDVADLHGTLTALRGLLAPGGALVFTGALRGRPRDFFPCEALQLTLRSYQRARLDPPYRVQAGYLSRDEWSRSLTRAGCAMAVAAPGADDAAAPHGGIIAWPT
jgi:pyochelin synthetase